MSLLNKGIAGKEKVSGPWISKISIVSNKKNLKHQQYRNRGGNHFIKDEKQSFFLKEKLNYSNSKPRNLT